MSIFKKKEEKPDLPHLHFYDIDIEAKNWDALFTIPLEEYLSHENGVCLRDKDIEMLEDWRKENPDWNIDVPTRHVWKKYKSR